jgi:Rrf2 family protein
MLYSKSTEYIIRALVYLSLQDKYRLVNVKEISENTDIPRPFCAKLFQGLAKTKWVISKKGKNGGIKFVSNPKDITLYDIVNWTEGINDSDRCIFGHKICNKENKCPLHNRCHILERNIIDFFRKTTINDFTKAWKKHSDDFLVKTG